MAPGTEEKVSDLVQGVPRATPADGGSVSRQELLLLFGLFVSFRIFAVPFFKPGGQVYDGAHDYHFYLQMAELSLEGFYPYVHFWLEYPPVFPLILLALYNLSLMLPAWPNSMLWFQLTVNSFLLVFDVGNLLLVYLIVRSIQGPRVGLRAAWMYAGLFYPMYVLINWFDVMPLFFILLGIYATIRGWPLVVGLSVGLGFMTKIIPAFLGPLALLAFRRWRDRVVVAVVAGAVVLAIALPFLLGDPTMAIASARSMVERSSWLTPWALLEGYYDVGNMPKWPERFVAESSTWEAHPQTLPWLWINATMALTLVALYTRRLTWWNPRVILAAAALSLNVLLLFSKGWSPQFLIYILALLVINLPNVRGLVYAVLFTANNFLEWPVAGVYFLDVAPVLAVAVTVRTTLLLFLSWEYVAILYPRLKPGWSWVRRRMVLPLAAAGGVLLVAGAWLLVGMYVDATPQRPLADYVEARSVPGQAVLASSREAFYALKPLIPNERFYLVREDTWSSDAAIAASLRRLTTDSPQAWIVLDYGNGEPRPAGTILAWLDAWGSRTEDVWFEDYRLVGYTASDAVEQSPPVNADGETGVNGDAVRQPAGPSLPF